MNRQKDLRRLLRLAGADRKWVEQGEVLAAQAGELCKCCYHTKSYPQDEQAYIAIARRALGDMILQAQLCCELMGIDSDEVFDEAFIAFRDEMARIVKERAKVKVLSPDD